MTAFPKWMTMVQTSRYTSISLKKCYDLCQQGQLPSAKIGGSIRVDRERLDKMLEDQIIVAQQRIEKLKDSVW